MIDFWLYTSSKIRTDCFRVTLLLCCLCPFVLRRLTFCLCVCDFLPFLLREKMESQLEKEARFCQLMAHSSHDSAIDTDSLEWETEVVEFEKDRVGAVLSSYH